MDQSLRSLAEGREKGCDELVILRGEATLREDLPHLVSTARRMGYCFVQLQTNGATLAPPLAREALLAAGVDAFEIMLLAASEGLHDQLSNAPGSFKPTLTAIQGLLQARRQVLVTVPVLAENMKHLGNIVAACAKLGVRQLQFNFPRPVELTHTVVTTPIPRLGVASFYVRQAAKLAQQHGINVSTEAIPFCHLPTDLRGAPDATEDWRRHRVDDLHVVHESLDAVRATQRPEPPPCRQCAVRDRCPKTWALYLELFGSGELTPIRDP